MSEAPAKKSRWLVVCLSLIPLWLAVSAGVAVWWSLRDDKQEEEERNRRFAMEMSVERIADDMRKFVEVIGPRNAENPEALMRAAAMIDGTLGPSNTGYQIKRIPGPKEAPIIHLKISGSQKGSAPYWLISGYDTAYNSEEITAASSTVTAMMAIAQAMARDKPTPDIHFFFLPFGNASRIQSVKLLPKLLTQSEQPEGVFYLDGHNGLHRGANLTVYSTITQSDEIAALRGIGNIVSMAETQNTILSFHQMSLGTPYHILSASSGSSQVDQTNENIAICAGKVVEWLRRASRLEAAK